MPHTWEPLLALSCNQSSEQHMHSPQSRRCKTWKSLWRTGMGQIYRRKLSWGCQPQSAIFQQKNKARNIRPSENNRQQSGACLQRKNVRAHFATFVLKRLPCRKMMKKGHVPAWWKKLFKGTIQEILSSACRMDWKTTICCQFSLI